MDLTAEYYLQTIETVFLEHKLAQGRDGPSQHDWSIPSKIRRVGADDRGGREGRHLRDRPDLCCTNFVHNPLLASMREHYMQPGVGHYGVFNGSRFRAEIAPKISNFITLHQRRKGILARAFGRAA